MSLLREIQEATTDPRFKLADVLRQAKILAFRLNHQDFKSWIEQELNCKKWDFKFYSRNRSGKSRGR